MAKPTSPPALTSGAPILARRAFTPRRISMRRPRTLGSISPVPMLSLFPPANSCIGLPTQKFRFACARFEKSQMKRRITISNATSISRNAKPNPASIGVYSSKNWQRPQRRRSRSSDCGSSLIGFGSASCSSIGRLPIMAAVLPCLPRGPSQACFSLTGVIRKSSHPHAKGVPAGRPI